MSNSLPCPVEQLIEHSATHFQAFPEPPTDGYVALLPQPETFAQLAARRAGNLDLMVRFLKALAAQAPNSEVRNPVDAAIDHLNNARRHLQTAAGR